MASPSATVTLTLTLTPTLTLTLPLPLPLALALALALTLAGAQDAHPVRQRAAHRHHDDARLGQRAWRRRPRPRTARLRRRGVNGARVSVFALEATGA